MLDGRVKTTQVVLFEKAMGMVVSTHPLSLGRSTLLDIFFWGGGMVSAMHKHIYELRCALMVLCRKNKMYLG